MPRGLRIAAIAAVLIWITPNATHASPIVLDFETFSDTDVLTTQVPGLTFTNAEVLTAGISVNEFEFPPASGVNVITDFGGPIRIDFDSPLAAFSGLFTYAIPLTLEAFDNTDNLLGSVFSAYSSNLGFSGDVGSTPNELLQVAFGNISYVIISGNLGGGSFTADDLVITPTIVPEPNVLALTLVGGLVALKRRLRRV
jgi:hypothetical protein